MITNLFYMSKAYSHGKFVTRRLSNKSLQTKFLIEELLLLIRLCGITGSHSINRY